MRKAMKRLLPFLMLAVFAVPACAQTVTVPFGWDASASSGVTYRVKRSLLPDMSSPVLFDTGTALQLDMSLAAGTYYIAVVAVGTCISADNGQQAPCESAPAPVFQAPTKTVMRVTVQIPPGNPGNAKVRVN
jgi:hypothetical protein